VSRSRFRLAALVIVAFALVSSACFQIRWFSLVGNKSLSPAAETQLQFDLHRMSVDNDNTGYIFMLLGLQDLDYTGSGPWDFQGNWGGPFTPMSDNTLRNYLLASDNCAANGVSATDMDASTYDEWKLMRTQVKFNSATQDLNDSFRLRLKVKREGGTTDTAFGHVVAFSGLWTDGNNDGIIDPGEATCTSAILTGIPFRP
jgi:hypothetical protein